MMQTGHVFALPPEARCALESVCVYDTPVTTDTSQREALRRLCREQTSRTTSDRADSPRDRDRAELRVHILLVLGVLSTCLQEKSTSTEVTLMTHPVSRLWNAPLLALLSGLLLAMTPPAIAEQVPNDGPEPEVAPGDIETKPVYARCSAGGACGEDRLQGHFSIGSGGAALTGQMAEVFNDSDLSMRISGGVEFGPFAIDFVITGTSLLTNLDSTPTTFSVGPTFRYTIDVLNDGGWRLGVYSQTGLSYASLSADENAWGEDDAIFDEYSGWGFNSGVGFLADYYMLRLFTDATHEWLWLENDTIDRHINGGLWAWTIGVGVVY